MTPEEFPQLVRNLAGLCVETEWVEFKRSYANPEEIGRNVSAISNSTALRREPMGYLVWGIQDIGHEIVGTEFRPHQERKGNEELENWLAHLLEPRIEIRIHEGEVAGGRVVVFEIPPASHIPTRFSGREYVRVGSYTKPLSEHPEKERALWALFSERSFEVGISAADVASHDVLQMIDYPEYFRLTQQPLPENRDGVLSKLEAERIIQRRLGDRYDITNVGGILFARDLRDFDRLARKALRVVIYRADDRTTTIKEQSGVKGYAVGFEGAVTYINDQLPQNEEIGQALRREVRMYPEIAIRELVANAIIHQDFNIVGAGPMVEIFANRMEITNPGVPLIDTLRFIDEPPRSRNETLAGLMRRMNVCEERGSGIDKVIFHVEAFQLPAPDFRVAGLSTVAVLFGPRRFAEMHRDERIRACYQHACLQHVSGRPMTNATLRNRLGIDKPNYPLASRIIGDTIKSQLIKRYSGKAGSPRGASYVPFWA